MDRCHQISKRINVHRYQGDRYTHLTNLIEVGQSLTIDGVGVRFVSRDDEGAAVVSLTGIDSRRHMLRCDSFAEWPNTFKSCAHAMQCVHLVNASQHDSCDDYCASLPGGRHTCFYAAEEYVDRCIVEQEEACSTNVKELYGSLDIMCGCTTTKTPDPIIPKCNSFAQWPNTFRSCSHVKHCVHLVETTRHASCDEYCASLPGHTCFYAAEDIHIDKCSIERQESCGTNIRAKHGTTDMLCGCAIPGQTAAPRQTTAATPGQTAATTVPVKPRPACPTCGTIKQTGKLSCCTRGGAWFKQCGDFGDSNFDHTWSEGIEACKGSCSGHIRFYIVG